MSRLFVHHQWNMGRVPWHRTWHWYVEAPGHPIRHGYAPWRWLAVIAARHTAASRDRAWARHLNAQELTEGALYPAVRAKTNPRTTLELANADDNDD